MTTATLFHEMYETETRHLTVRGRKFRFFVPKVLDSFVDPADVFHAFPLWAKIWEASIVLADHLAGMPPAPEKRFLEIGAGLGVTGIVAAAFGHHVTMTEFNPDAVRFALANARINLDSGNTLRIMELDWNRPLLEGRFDLILGSEVVYKEPDFEPIRKLVDTYLKPDGECLFAEGVRRTSIEFFRRMERHFELKAYRKTLRSKDKAFSVILCRMRFKRNGAHSPAGTNTPE